MIAILICDRDAQEQDIIAQNCRRQVAIRSEESAQIEKLSDSDALSVAVGNEKLIDLLYYDFNADRTLGKLREFRNRYKESMLMLIADASVSPLEYLRPGIAPDSLMLRPLNQSLLDTVNGEFIELTHKEFELLQYLVENKPNVLSRDQILQKVWGYDFFGNTNVVDVYISYLRSKIDDKFNEKHIKTIRGVGYACRD